MKKVIYFMMLIGVILFCGCDDHNSNTRDIPFYDQIVIEDYDTKTTTVESITELKLPQTISKIDKFTFEGHEYIRFKFSGGSTASGGAIHNPECKKCKEGGR